MKGFFEKHETLAVWAVALAAAIGYCLLFHCYWPGADYDTFDRYAPMAEEFAKGNLRMAYHPRFCVLFTSLTGALVTLTGCSGFAACQAVSIVAWCLSSVPLWFIARKTFDADAAWWSVAALLLIPEYAGYCGDGMREGLRILSYLLFAWGFLSRSRWVALGIFLSATLRADGVLMGGAMLSAYAMWVLWRREWMKAVLPFFALAAAVVLDSWMVYWYCGYFVPSSHFVKMLGGL